VLNPDDAGGGGGRGQLHAVQRMALGALWKVQSGHALAPAPVHASGVGGGRRTVLSLWPSCAPVVVDSSLLRLSGVMLRRAGTGPRLPRCVELAGDDDTCCGNRGVADGF
jgi:hypothetical protein